MTVLVSSDPTQEGSVIGKGLYTGGIIDSAMLFKGLKAAIETYRVMELQSLSSHDVQRFNQYDVRPNKKEFWTMFRKYCRKQNSETKKSNWILEFWSGYPLYREPVEAAEGDNNYLSAMASSANLSMVDVSNYCGITHRKLHDMLNKQYKKTLRSCNSTNAAKDMSAARKPSCIQSLGEYEALNTRKDTIVRPELSTSIRYVSVYVTNDQTIQLVY